ncbi:site-specific DNA-methyltransferase [Clostridium sp. BSD9I1]|uniref:site-specific DNA-methyltransferase n=1 Tax=Clostridium sp. BSD9I1 TaxID=2003589 RepID=UPI0016477843|nr:site-specific DNA-methyltransferase [Clostridium sp. BSD9I1]
MLKDIIEKNENVAINQRQIDILKRHFPSCFTNEGNFDVKKLEQVLNENEVDITKEGYELNFLGKSYAKLLTALESETVIKPDLEHNSKEENKSSENIYITGDNLDSIKHLLKSYAGNIKCIYIDPPYNTGSDGFAYMDNFKFTPEQLSEKIGISEEEAQRILNMTSRGSASHSAWLTFMYPRLYLSRDLLSDDGIIFISIDDNELANLKLLCDEIFGEQNLLSNLIWKTDGNFDNQAKIKNCHESIVAYAKNIQCFPAPPVIDTNIPDTSKLYKDVIRNTVVKNGPKNPISSIIIPKGFPAEIQKGIIENREGFWPQYNVSIIIEEYKTQNEVIATTGWGSKDLLESFINEGYKKVYDTKGQECEFILTKTGTIEVIKKRLEDQSHVISVLTNLSSTQSAGSQLKEMGIPFSYPKPVELIKYLIQMNTGNDFTILDFFSGSATTAHAIMQLNAEDGGNRKYIMVQIPEKCKEDGEAYKVGYRTINQIGIDRIKLASEKIKNEIDKDIDYGFKIYELVSSQEQTLDKILAFDPDKLVEDISILKEFGSEAVLITWKVQDGYGFNAQLKEINLSEYTAYQCDNTLYFINPNITTQAIKILIEKYQNDSSFFPNRIILFGYSFNFTQLSQLRDNLKQLAGCRKIDVITRY